MKETTKKTLMDAASILYSGPIFKCDHSFRQMQRIIRSFGGNPNVVNVLPKKRIHCDCEVCLNFDHIREILS